MENAWAFYRRSTDRQELSLEDQRRECHAFATARGWQIVREFEPSKSWGSGLTIDQDPSFQEMIRAAERGGHSVRHLVVYDVSRFGRLITEEKIYWEQRFKKHGGIQIVYVHEDFKNDGSLGDTLLKVVKHAEAHEFSRKLSEVTLRGAKSHAALGHSAGGAAPFGYDRLEINGEGQPVRVMSNSTDWKSNKLHRVIWTPSPLKAPIVRWVFETYDKGTGLNRLVQQLNEQRTPAPRGRHWSKTMVHYMLRNRAYLGERIYNRRSYKAYRRGERGQLANPHDAWVVKQHAHEPIIDSKLFERVQTRRVTRVITMGRTFQRPYLLTGIMRCARCGYRMIGTPLSGNGHRYLTYTCSGYVRIGRSVCRSVHVLCEPLEQQVLQSIRKHLTSPSWKEEVRETLAKMVDEECGDTAKSRAVEIEHQLETVTRQVGHIVDAIKTSGRLSEAMNQALADLETQRDSIREQLKDAERRVNKRLGAKVLTEEILANFGDFDRVWREGLTIEQRKELLRCYLHEIKLDHSPTDVRAEIWLYKIPIPKTQMTPVLDGLEPLITRVNCGGRNLTLVSDVPKDILPFITTRVIELKPPYVHYRRTAA
jgi:DNA invertase Pin-like site-specific DNA recombinase